jgi:diguanylate cyclase (GGDEF)-like protein
MSRQETRAPKLLIVEDDPAICTLLTRLLEGEYQCESAASGDEAFRKLNIDLPDLVISDINMPGMSGLELIPKIAAISSEIVTMVISGEQSFDNAIEAIRAGAFDFIKKPFELDHVQMAVRRAIAHHDLLVAKRKHEQELEDLVYERTKQINYLAYFDALTDLPNRAKFEHGLARAYAENPDQRRAALLLVSPHRFKDIRDTLGHSFGDQIIIEIARRLRRFQADDIQIARLDADEFGLFLSDISERPQVEALAQGIFRELRASFTLEGHELAVSFAIGASLSPEDGTEGSALIKNAGAALTRAKDSGSNALHFFTADMHKEALERLTLLNDLRKAVEDRSFQTYFQPKIKTSTGQIVGTEALIRWPHKRHGLVSPLDFIPIAEETGMIVDIGEWVLREACIQTKRWQDAGHNIHVAVNVSAVQLDMGLARTVHRVISETELNPEHLNLEMTESSIMKNPEFAIRTLGELRDLGIKISIDDFGTGFSSLGQLKNFPIDVLKIDKTFINDVTTDTDSASLVKGIIRLAQTLRLRVVAEGVETEEQLRFLNALQCDEWQGFLFSGPVPSSAMRELLESRSSIHAYQ